MIRYIMSYGVALALVLLIALWLVSGTLVEGGKGPGNGQTAMIDVIETNESGPVRTLFKAIGLISDPDADEDATEMAATEANQEMAPEEEAPELQSVRVEVFSAQQMPINVALRGRTKANATLSVRAETTGILKQMHVTKGEHVNAGDLLCTLDRGTREARVAQANAALAQANASLAGAQGDFDTNAALRERGLAAANTAREFEVSLTAADASVLSAQASLDDATTELTRTEVRAEVSGIIQDPIADIGDMLNAGGLCATIVQLDPMLFVGSVAEGKIGLLRVGMSADITTVTGQSAGGIVRFISSSADEATRSFDVEIEISNLSGELLAGVTAQASIHSGTTGAHHIPQSVLTLETDGTIGVQTVEGDTAHFMPVQLIRDDEDGIWVGGLPPSVNIITLGQEYVLDGQTVAPSYAQEGTQS